MAISETDLTALADRVRGPVLLPGQDGYDDELSGFQTAFHHRPAVIVGAAAAPDVQAAMRFAVSHGLPVAVQATGHGVTVLDHGGLLVTTGRMTGIKVDPHARRAWIEAGARWAQVAERAAPHGLAPLSGSAPDVGVAGYTLGGGTGLLSREFGFAADHVHALDVVTADGQLRHVTAERDPALFWALRGGRDNFGIVTSLEIGLLPVSRIYGGGLFFDAAQADEILAAFRDWTAAAPETLTGSVGTISYPPLPVFPEPLRGRDVVHVRFVTTDTAAGPDLVQPWRKLGSPIIGDVREMPYTDAGEIFRDPDFPHAYFGNSVLLRELDPAVLRAIHELAGPAAPVPCITDLRHLGGAMSRTPEVPSAVSFREARYIVRVLSPLGRSGLPDVRAAHQRVYDAVAPWTLGRSVNFIYGEATATQFVAELYDEQTLTRLAEIKARYDPANVLCRTHNIRPGAQ